jgi:hypothetical protein
MGCRIIAMADKILDALMRYHREVVRPELEEFRAEVRSRFDGMVTRADMAEHMKNIHQRFDRLEAIMRG